MDKDHGWVLSSSDEDDDDASILPRKQEKRKFMSPARMKRKLQQKSDASKEKPICKYGDECYRKNSEHLTEFHHPKKRKLDECVSHDPSSKHGNQMPSSDKATAAFKTSKTFNFFLTTVQDIPKKFASDKTSDEFASPPSIGISDILSTKFGKVIKSAQFNYCIDIAWLMEQYPAEVRGNSVLIVHGEQAGNNVKLKAEASSYPNIQLCRADLPPFGTHHTKMMLLLYKEGLRVIIGTANLVEQDWRNKSQGLWMSPLFPKTTENTASKFQDDLVFYLNAYKKKELEPWIKTIKEHDMISANVLLVASVPGRHVGQALSLWGHMRLRKLLATHVRGIDHTWPVIGQFSSIGSLGANKDKWVCGEWLASLSACQRKKLLGPVSKADLKLIFPTVENVRCSLDGYPSGASLPYSSANAKKQPWLKSFMHQWNADHCGRTEASPHIKSYARISPFKTNVRAAWFLLTSANLSKAAWGCLEKLNSQLAIKSYELGVLFIPSLVNNTEDSGSETTTEQYFYLSKTSRTTDRFYLPYSLPLVPYKPDDEPWTWDAPHTDGPDRFGNIWVPS